MSHDRKLFVHLPSLAHRALARLQTGYPSDGLGYMGNDSSTKVWSMWFLWFFYSGVKKWSKLDAVVRDGSCLTPLVSITFFPNWIAPLSLSARVVLLERVYWS